MHAFDRDIGGVQGSDKEIQVSISDQWSINHIPNGGYIMALMIQAMQGEDKTLVTCIVTANYLERCECKPARILVETISLSRHFIRKQARLFQEGQERTRVMGTFIRSMDQPLPRHYEKEPESLPLPDQCFKVPPISRGYTLFDQVDMRLDPGSAGWTQGKFTDRSVQKGWIRFQENREIDVPAITFFADCFPPCIFATRGMVAWVPTIEYSVNVRQLPAPGWLKGIFRTRFISSGLVEEDGELWDEQGSLVAISRQIAKYHPTLIENGIG